MIPYNAIKDIHLEISTLCNAQCPLCPRNLNGYTYNNGYPEVSMTLEQAQLIFKPAFIAQLERVLVNGNFGDAIANPQTVDILRYFRSNNPTMKIEVSTNGGTRNEQFWKALAAIDALVVFCIDGLEDTNHLYRQGVKYDKLMHNVKTFIAAGGRALWKMVPFDHNKHQIAEAEQLSKDMGFIYFTTSDCGRNTGPVFNSKGEYTHALGNYSGTQDINVILHERKQDCRFDWERPAKKNISCQAKNTNSIYVAANGDISPCCWTWFYPKTYGKGDYFQEVNKQIVDIVYKNNALEHPLEECIEWFSAIEATWAIANYKDGRLITCDDLCGSD